MFVNWAGTLLGCFALILAPMPFLFYKYSKIIRSKIRFEPCIDLKVAKFLSRGEQTGDLGVRRGEAGDGVIDYRCHDFSRSSNAENDEYSVSSFVAHSFCVFIPLHFIKFKYRSSIKRHSINEWLQGRCPEQMAGLVMRYKAQGATLRFATRTSTSQVNFPSPNLPWNPSILMPSLARYQLLTLQMQRKNYSIIFEVIFTIFSNPPPSPEIDFLGGKRRPSA
jgi:hypothetical protein